MEENKDLEKIISETEKKSKNLLSYIDNEIHYKESKIKKFRKSLKKFIATTLVCSIIGLSIFGAYAFKKRKDSIFGHSMYYEVSANETLINITEKVCGSTDNLDEIVEFNKNLDENFDSIASEGEIIRFPKKHVKNPEYLNSFIKDYNVLKKKLEKNNKIVELAFNSNLQKEKIDSVYKTLDELNKDEKRYEYWKSDIYFSRNAVSMLRDIAKLEDEIKTKVNSKVKEIDYEFKKLKDFFYSNNWKKPGTIEWLESLISRNKQIRYSYECFRKEKNVLETKSIEQKIKSVKSNYINLLNKISNNISQDKYKINQLEKKVNSIFKLGLQNKEIPILREIINEKNNINSYSEWEDEKRLETQLNEYMHELSELKSQVNSKFYFAVNTLNKEIKKYEEEIAHGEKTGRIKGADTRLKYIMEKPLAMIKYRYGLLDYNKGITRTNKLINKINSFIKN